MALIDKHKVKRQRLDKICEGKKSWCVPEVQYCLSTMGQWLWYNVTLLYAMKLNYHTYIYLTNTDFTMDK